MMAHSKKGSLLDFAKTGQIPPKDDESPIKGPIKNDETQAK
jgi:hypothetical protein